MSLGLDSLGLAPLGLDVYITTSPDAFPASDVIVAGWTASAGSSLAACIDETVADDGDYILSPPLDGSQGAYVGTLTQPLAAGSYTLHVRGKYTVAAAQIRATLLDASDVAVGNTGYQALTGALATYDLPVTITGTATKIKLEVL